MNWDEVLTSIARRSGAAGVSELERALERLKREADEPWKGALLQVFSEAISARGLDGAKIVDRLIDGKRVDLNFLSLRARSDYLAALQNMEADEKKKARDYLDVVGKNLGIVFRAIISGVIG